MCNLMLGVLFLVFNPNFWHGLGKIRNGVVNLMERISNWLATVSDQKAHEIVTQMIEEGLDPAEARKKYVMIRFGILFGIVFGPIFLCGILSNIG